MTAQTIEYNEASLPNNACRQIAGRFDLAVQKPEMSGMQAALMTGLLVLFPTFATAAAIVAGMMLTGTA
ncbi:hypothetical protein [Mesorhizobium sp. A623]